MWSDTLLKPYESVTHYILSEIGRDDKAEPFDATTGLQSTVEECVRELQEHHPHRDLSEFHVIRQTYYNEGPLTDALRLTPGLGRPDYPATLQGIQDITDTLIKEVRHIQGLCRVLTSKLNAEHAEDEENEMAHVFALIDDKSDDLINGIGHIAGLATRPRTLARLVAVTTPTDKGEA